ncbi:MAG: response regulator [Acidobacteria bacterium]|nr:response regulator [Acidobacteriota bacterium]
MASSANPAETQILLVGAEWKPRALIRAQLIEEGHEVEAVESWEEAELLLRRRARQPLVLIIDLAGEPHAAAALATLKRLFETDRALILTSASALSSNDVQDAGFPNVLARPFSIGDVVSATSRVLARARAAPSGPPDARDGS